MIEFFSLLRNATIALPVLEVSVLVLALSYCLAQKWTDTGLVIAYMFVYHWGWLFFAKQNTLFFGIYLVLGAFVLTLSILDMFKARSRR